MSRKFFVIKADRDVCDFKIFVEKFSESAHGPFVPEGLSSIYFFEKHQINKQVIINYGSCFIICDSEDMIQECFDLLRNFMIGEKLNEIKEIRLYIEKCKEEKINLDSLKL